MTYQITRNFFSIFICIFVLWGTFTFPHVLHAETHITDGYFPNGTEWTKEGSPYILEDYVFVPKGFSLHIDAGVTVMSASTTDGNNPFYMAFPGDMSAWGTADDPVRIIGLGNLSFNGSSVDIQHVSFEGTGITINQGTTTMRDSSIVGADIALSAKRSHVSITGSTLSGNAKGIFSALWSAGPFLSSIVDENAIGGLGNAADTMDPQQNVITINDSILAGNSGYSIQNMTPNTIDASDNWWGNPSGPASAAVSGAVVTDPWKKADPNAQAVPCCSNVLFLPGIEASRLYYNDPNPTGAFQYKLWEPIGDSDVGLLYLDPKGKSVTPGVYTKDVVDSAYGFVSDIYKNFISMMNEEVADKTINEWLPFAYDWRMNVSDVVSGMTQYATTTKSLVAETEKLARSSKTGKVTIVAHSNGGLVAKMLGNELAKKGESQLIDKVILVATPQLGTPQAIAGLLHGSDQSIAGGLILSQSTARQFGLTMPGAYGLLPSPAYFAQVLDPVISLAGSAIETYSSFIDFVTGKIDKRTQPKQDDVSTPALLSKNLLTQAQWMHTIADTWQFPTTTQTLFVSGWGKDTTHTIQYDAPDVYSLLKTKDGDGTVLTDSSRGPDSQTLYFNQSLLRHDTKQDFSHANILEAGPIEKILQEALATSTASLADLPLPSYISHARPKASDYPWMGSLVVSVHSPLDIDVYDSHGGHIGLVPLKDKLPGHPDSDLMWLDNTLGGEYEDLAGEKYVTLPTDGGENYSVQLKGTGVGKFTFEVQKFNENNVEVASSTYADLPVTPLLNASTTVNALTISPPLNLDVDGDGKIDIQATSSPVGDPQIHLDSLRAVILSLHLKPALEKALLLKIETLKTLLSHDKAGKFRMTIHHLSNVFKNKHWTQKKLTDADRQDLAQMLDSLLDAFGKN